MLKKIIFLFLVLCISTNIFSNEIPKDSNGQKSNETNLVDGEKNYQWFSDNEQITIQTRKYFDPMLPLDATEFIIMKGKTRITDNDFYFLTLDPLLIKNNRELAKVKRGGLIGAAVLGGVTASFFTVSAVFIALQTTYYLNPSSYGSMGYKSWYDYFMDSYPSLFFTGLFFTALTVVGLVALLIDLLVTYSLIHKYKNNEKAYREAAARYNNMMMKKYSLIPDLGYNSETSDLMITFKLKF